MVKQDRTEEAVLSQEILAIMHSPDEPEIIECKVNKFSLANLLEACKKRFNHPERLTLLD